MTNGEDALALLRTRQHGGYTAMVEKVSWELRVEKVTDGMTDALLRTRQHGSRNVVTQQELQHHVDTWAHMSFSSSKPREDAWVMVVW